MAITAKDIGVGLRVSCALYEGVWTCISGSTPNGTTDKFYTASAPLKAGDIVQLYTASTDTDAIIVAADDRDPVDGADITASATKLDATIGIIVTNPSQFPTDVSSLTGSETFTASSASQMRMATVEFPGKNCVREFVISGSPKAGTLVGWDTSENKFADDVGGAAIKQGVLMTSASADGTGSVMF